LGTIKQLFQKPASAFGASLLVLFFLLAVFGPYITPFSGVEFVGDPFESPSTTHWFGTDNYGRDVLSRVVLGARSILAMAGIGTLLAVLSGLIFGLVSGYIGGLFDEILMRAFDSLLSIPALLFALLLLGTLGHSPINILLVLIIVFTPIVARVVRSEVLSIKTKGFVEASRLQGEKTGFILTREILPSVLPALSVEASMRFTYAIFLVASLGFLGVGVQPPTPDWGLMVSESRNFARTYPWMLIFPAAAISLLVIGTNLTADRLKSVLQVASTTSFIPRKFRNRRQQTPREKQSSTALVSVDKLSIGYYQNGRWLDAVRDVSLEIEAGQSLGLVGESGSGKSTLALAILNALEFNGMVREGQIYHEGRDLVTLNARQMRQIWGREISLVPQDPLSSLNPSLRVGEQISEILRLHMNLAPSEASKRVIELLEGVQIADPRRVARSYPHELSGGMQQRVMIAMALSTEPKLLILDEPTTGLDVTTEAVVLNLIRDLIKKHNTAALYISHDLAVVREISDRVAVLYAGELVEEGQVEELFAKPVHPYTQGLLYSVPSLGMHKSQTQLATMTGQIPSLRDLPTGCIFTDRCPLAIEACSAARPPSESVNTNGASSRSVRCIRWNEIVSGKIEPHFKSEQLVTQNSNQREPAERVSVLQASNVTKHFKLSRSIPDVVRRKPQPVVKAVDDISFQINSGNTFGLVGESGSGKSTLARSASGLISLTDGTFSLLDQELSPALRERKFEMMQQLQMVFQNPHEALNPHRTIGDTLRRTFHHLGRLSQRDARAAVPELLRQVRLDESYVRRLPAQLSGGEKQRVAIARAFATHPDLIICDEPTSALDVSVQARILNLLNELQSRESTAYLFISHDLAVVGYLADYIGVIYLGQLMELSDRVGFFEPPYHPYTEALLSSVSMIQPGVHSEPILLKGEIPSPTDVPRGCPFYSRCPHVLGDVCRDTKPPWRSDENGKQIYCHIPLDELGKIQSPVVNAKSGRAQ